MGYQRAYSAANYSNGQINVLDSLQCELAQDAFMWAVDVLKHDYCHYKAEAFAREVDNLSPSLDWMLEITAFVQAVSGHFAGPSMEDLEDLKKFILKRHAHWRFGGRKSTYLEAANA